jgi:hypothetical protein
MDILSKENGRSGQYYVALEKKEILYFTWMTLYDIMLNEISQS